MAAFEEENSDRLVSKAVERGNKSAAQYLIEKKKRAEANAVNGEGLAEETGDLNSNLGIIADQLSGIADFVEKRDEKEDSLYKEEKAKERSRSVYHADFGTNAAVGAAGLGAAGAMAMGGGSDSSNNESAPSYDNEEEGGIANLAMGFIGNAAMFQLGKRVLKRVNPNAYGKVVAVEKGLKGFGKKIPIAAGVLTATDAAYRVSQAQNVADEKTAELASEISTDLENREFLQAGAMSGFLNQGFKNEEVLKAIYEGGVSTTAAMTFGALGAGAGSLFGPVGAIALGLLGSVGGAIAGTFAGEKVAAFLADKDLDKKLSLMGLTRDDLNLAERIAKGGRTEIRNVQTEWETLVREGKMTKDEAMQKALNANRALRAIYMGFGEKGVPETWNVDWEIPYRFGTKGDPEKIKTLEPTSIFEPIYKSSTDIFSKIVLAATSSQKYTSMVDEKERAKYVAEELRKNRLKIGLGGMDSYSQKSGYDLPGEFTKDKTETPERMSPYSAGLAVDLFPGTEEGAEILKSYGLRRIKGDMFPNRYFNTKDVRYNALKEKGLISIDPSSSKTNPRAGRVIKPGVEPEYLATGGILRQATSLGYVNGITSLEDSGREIADTLRTGLQRISGDESGFFDDAIMDYLMDSVLPGLVDAFKRDEPMEQGMEMTVNVFA